MFNPFKKIKDLAAGELDHHTNRQVLNIVEKIGEAVEGDWKKNLSPETKRLLKEKRELLLRYMNIRSAIDRAEDSGEDQTEEGRRIREEREEAAARFLKQAEEMQLP